MKKISKNYAKSFFQKIVSNINIENNAENLKERTNQSLEELFLLSSTITSSKKLMSFFQNPFFSEQKKYEILINLFSKLSLETQSLLKILLDKREIFLLPEIFIEYKALVEKLNKIKKVKLITASYLDKNLGPILLNKLKAITKAEQIILEIEYKKELLGGLILEFDSLALDASIVREFQVLIKEI